MKTLEEKQKASLAVQSRKEEKLRRRNYPWVYDFLYVLDEMYEDSWTPDQPTLKSMEDGLVAYVQHFNPPEPEVIRDIESRFGVLAQISELAEAIGPVMAKKEAARAAFEGLSSENGVIM